MASLLVHDRNVVAVDLLRQGLYVQARAILSTALSDLMVSVEDQHAQPNIVAPAASSQRISPIGIDDALPTDTNTESTFAMYKKVFLLDSNNSDDLTKAVVIFYNLGVAYHAMGLTSGNTHLLNQALRLYAKVDLVFHTQDPADTRYLTLIHLATCNNMGHIFSILLNTLGVDASLDRIRSSLATLQRSGLDAPEMNFFMFLVLMGTNRFLTMAPAA
mmetsp:Transcript_8289/g.10862  ORF Transcript_8289/g.10862 Transcript_8289/m.10862 type:complete len:217 (-) Transcript_8289:34-684(-)